MPLSTTTVVGAWVVADNQAATGLVTFQPVVAAPGGGYIVAGAQVPAILAAGAISLPLVNNSQVPGLQYLVTERITGAPVVTYVITPTGATLDLSTAPRGTSDTPVTLYVLASAVGAASGVAPLDGTSKIPSQYLPSGSGVLSVAAADGTITIGGTAVNPLVGVNVIPESKVTGLPADLAALSTAIAAKATKPIIRRAKIANPGDTTLPNTGASWAAVAGFELAIPAAAGDDVEIDFSAMRNPNANAFLDIAIIVGASLVRFMATGTSSPALEGDPGWYTQTGFICHAGPRGLTVTNGDLDNGNVRFVLACKAGGAGTVFSSTNYPFNWRAINHGAVN